MKKYMKITLFIICLTLSFYFTEKTASLARDRNPIMQQIKEVSNEYQKQPVDAIINDKYIIPGLYGQRINEIKSLMKMKEKNIFNDIFLVTDEIKPDISIEKHKDKIIKSGNKEKQAISFIIDASNSKIIEYLINKKINASILVNDKTLKKYSNLELINNDFNNYTKIETLLTKENKNINICIVNKYNYDICKKYKKYLVEPTYTLNDTNIIEIKNNITSGSIIKIDTYNTEYLNVLINYIKSKNISIINLSELISEKN